MADYKLQSSLGVDDISSRVVRVVILLFGKLSGVSSMYKDLNHVPVANVQTRNVMADFRVVRRID